MNARARAKAATQHGLLSRQDAFDAGYVPSQISARLRRGEWRAVRRGIYAEADLWDSLDPYRGRPLLLAYAATMMMRRGWVFSHDTAALLLGLQAPPVASPTTHITRPGYTTAWTRYGVTRHYASYLPSQAMQVSGTPTLDPARTAADVARYHGVAAGLVVADSALRHGATKAHLLEAAAAMRFWPGVTDVDEVIDLADPRAENANESLARQLVIGLGLGEVDLQVPVRIEGRLAWCDLRVGNHIFEVDGAVKYRAPQEGGVAQRPASEVVWDERKRERLLRGRNLGVSRIVWEDHSGTDAQVKAARTRLTEEALVTHARFGREFHPELADDAARLRARFGRRDRADDTTRTA